MTMMMDSLPNPFRQYSPDNTLGSSDDDDDFDDDRASDTSSEEVSKAGTDYEPDRHWHPEDTSFTSFTSEGGDGYPLVLIAIVSPPHEGDEA